MATERIRLSTLGAATAIWILLAYIAPSAHEATAGQRMVFTGAERLLAIFTLLALTWKMQAGLDPIGLAPAALWPGVKRGIVWSLVFGGLVAAGFTGCHLAGINPLGLFKVPLPQSPIDVVGYFVVGAGLAPIAEEIYFRGLLYGYLRRWGPAAAVVGSTLLFVAAHPNLQQIPVAQLVGGLVFAIAYETEKKLMAPIVIHAAGNLALFSLSLMQ